MDVQPGQMYHNPRADFYLHVVPNLQYQQSKGDLRYQVEWAAAGATQWQLICMAPDLEQASLVIERYLGDVQAAAWAFHPNELQDEAVR